MSRENWNAPGYDAGETAKFPKGFLPLKGDNAPRSHYERYVKWSKKNKAVEKPITSLPELVAKAFLTDPRTRSVKTAVLTDRVRALAFRRVK